MPKAEVFIIHNIMFRSLCGNVQVISKLFIMDFVLYDKLDNTIE